MSNERERLRDVIGDRSADAYRLSLTSHGSAEHTAALQDVADAIAAYNETFAEPA